MSAAWLVLAAALSAGNAEFDEAARSGAYQIAVGRAASAIAERGPERGRLAAALLADPAKFASAEASKDAARESYLGLVADEVEAERRRIEERLGFAPGTAPARAALAPGAALKSFEARYAEERRAACETQARSIVSATRPTPEEFEGLSDGELRDMMTERIVGEQKTPVFDENRRYISERIVQPVVEAARAEQRRQREYLQHARSDAAAPSKLSEELASRLRANVAGRAKSVDPAGAWGVFPSVLAKTLPEVVERRTVERFVSHVEGVKLDVGADDVLKAIAEDPAGHVRRAESERKFVVACSARVLADALAGAVAAAPEEERAELDSWLRGRLESAPVARSVDRLVRRDVMPKWRTAREEAARRVAEETWPSLCDGSWFPDPELADAVAARSDYTAAVRNWRSEKGMEALSSAGGGTVLEEAGARADAAVAKAFDLARGAIAAQNGIVDGCHASVLAESRARKESFWRRTPDLRAVTAMLTDAVEARWGETRVATLWPDGALPPNAAEQHRELFPSVRRKIELLAKTILEEMNEPREENPPEPEPDDEEKKLELTLYVNRDGDRVEVRLESGGARLAEESVPARTDDFENAMHLMTKKLSRDVLKLR